MGATSAHFSNSEMACKCGCRANECVPELLAALEAFRAAVGAPVIVNSGYRCPAHNAAVGGAKASQHVLGRAADVRVKGRTPAELEAVARAIPAIRGIGRDDHKGFVHLDVRETPNLAAWCYSKDGGQCPYYPPA